MLRQTFLAAVALLVFFANASLLIAQPAGERPSGAASVPLSPADALKTFHLPDELKIELVAAEPEVVDPVAIRFDEQGRLWVAEMRDYPTGPTPDGKQQSRIRLLEDRDGDGRYEKASIFADGRSFVTGLQPWRGGVIVTESGKVSYLKDNDGDGKADQDETWFTGFIEGNTQLRANHPRLALDNFVYIANGLRGGSVIDHRSDDKTPIPINGMDFRFNPLGGRAEAVSGVGQFGMAFDDWGNRFICSNRNPVRHVVIEDRYLKANPQVSIAAVANDVAAFGEQSRVFPLTRAWTTSNLHAGQFTAACGVFVYRGDALPREYRGNAFTCDPTGNLVHREIMEPRGATFTSKPAYENREWLASTDEWFRPVSMELGPDGALYVVDMYRAVIEHPEFMPDELKNRPDLRLGDDRGRIYRITAKNWQPTDRPKTLAAADKPQLVAALASDNAWQRETAQRLLLEQGEDGSNIASLLKSDASPAAQAHALRFQPAEAELIGLLQSKHPQVRRQALLVAEAKLKDSPALRNQVQNCLSDDDASVRFQALLSLALHQQHEVPRLAEALKPADFENPWTRSAIELAAGAQAGDLLAALLAKSSAADEPAGARALYAGLAHRAVVLGKLPAAQRIVGDIARATSDRTSDRRLALVLIEAVARAGKSQGISLASTATDDSAKTFMEKLSQQSADIARDDNRAAAERTEAIALLAHFADSADTLTTIIRAEPDQTLRQAAVTALAQQPNQEVWRELLEGVGGMTPAVRRSILEAAIGPAARASLLLDAIEAGHLKPAELDLLQANRLRQHRDTAVRERAKKLLDAGTPTDRVAALEQYQAALQLTGDAIRGRAIFEKNCSTCHRVGDVGVNVAPDISDTRTKTPAQLLADIVQPNRAIDNNYIAYNVLLADGTNTTGILTTESTTSITLKQPGDKTIVVARDDIEELRSSGVSLMPEGLEKNIDLQAMADLLAYLKNWRYLDGKTPLGK